MSDIFKDLVVCRRKDCEYYCTLKQNNCEILRKVYENDFKCKFYKRKNDKCKECKNFDDLTQQCLRSECDGVNKEAGYKNG